MARKQEMLTLWGSLDSSELIYFLVLYTHKARSHSMHLSWCLKWRTKMCITMAGNIHLFYQETGTGSLACHVETGKWGVISLIVKLMNSLRQLLPHSEVGLKSNWDPLIPKEQRRYAENTTRKWTCCHDFGQAEKCWLTKNQKTSQMWESMW